MAITVQEIVKSARNRESALADYTTHVNSGEKLSYNSFIAELDKKFPINGPAAASQSGGNTNNSGGPNTFQKAGGSILNFGANLVATQESTGGYLPGMSAEYIKMSELIKGMLDSGGNIKGIGELVKATLSNIAGQVELYYKQQTELLHQVNEQAGLTGDFSRDFRDELTQANPQLLRIGIGFEELANSAVKVVENSGKFTALSRETWKEAGYAAKAYVGQLSDLVGMYPAFEKVGLGASDSAKEITKAGQKSIELGLQSQKVTKELGTNLGKINEYGFKNGIQGLAEMVRKSIEFRMNMESVTKIAEKVFNPEGAIDLAANLQAIGGAIGDFNDPLKMMYMATNNVEGLQDALIGAAGSLATYNKEQNRFEVTGANLRKSKAMADELGMSMQELNNIAIAAAERSAASAELMASGLKLDEDQKRFITNISTMKDGKMTIALQSDKLREAFDASEIALENLTEDQAKQLMKYQEEFKKLTPEDIVRKQATDIENISRDMNFVAALLRQEFAKTGTSLAKSLGYDPAAIAEQTKNLANEWGPNIKGAGQFLRGKIEGADASKKVEEALKENKEKRGGTTQTQQPTEVTVNFKTNDRLQDDIYRNFFNQPDTKQNLAAAVFPSREYDSPLMA